MVLCVFLGVGFESMSSNESGFAVERLTIRLWRLLIVLLHLFIHFFLNSSHFGKLGVELSQTLFAI